ncbi:MAG: hypothetical protein O9972_24515 [Burkholderiales bacterium]|jgi:hypothetical protein|nr:hypothetical protein [Burkholderiales bacterium]
MSTRRTSVTPSPRLTAAATTAAAFFLGSPVRAQDPGSCKGAVRD